jgi:hypothetical protein
MPTPYTEAMRDGSTEVPEYLTYLRYDVAATRGRARDRQGIEIEKAIWDATVSDPIHFASCHPDATALLDMLGAGGVATTNNEDGLRAAQAAIETRNAAIHCQAGEHSFVIVSGPGAIESLEGWAGDQGYTLKRSIVDDPKEIDYETARVRILLLRDANDPTRNQALLSFTRLADAEMFGDGVQHITIRVKRLDTAANVTRKVRERVDALVGLRTHLGGRAPAPEA